MYKIMIMHPIQLNHIKSIYWVYQHENNGYGRGSNMLMFGFATKHLPFGNSTMEHL